eukprot:365375-Chlamydomonas_euryale.AAC.2
MGSARSVASKGCTAQMHRSSYYTTVGTREKAAPAEGAFAAGAFAYTARHVTLHLTRDMGPDAYLLFEDRERQKLPRTIFEAASCCAAGVARFYTCDKPPLRRGRKRQLSIAVRCHRASRSCRCQASKD